MSIEILTRNESVKYLGLRISLYQQETTEIKSPIRGGMGDLPQTQTRVDINKLHGQTSSSAFFDATVSPIVCYAAGKHGHQTKNTKE